MATDYISREKAIEIICGQCAFKDACDAGVEPRCSYYIRMTQIPADVRPVVKSRWVEIDDYVLCANCGVAEHSPNRNYCHGCGADMRVVKVDG